MVLELNDSHEKANVGKLGLKERVLIPFLAGTIAMSMFSGCSKEVEILDTEFNDDYSNSQTMDDAFLPDGDYLKIDERTFVLRDGVSDPKYSEDEYLGSTHVIADSEDNVVVSGYIGREVARFKGDFYIRDNALTTRDFNYITDMSVSDGEDLSWIKYCDNLDILSIRKYADDIFDYSSSKDVLAEAPALRRLELTVPTFTRDNYGCVSKMENLRELSLGCDYVEPGFVESLTQLDSLRIEDNDVNNINCFDLEFLDSLEFYSPYCAAINMSMEEYEHLTDAGVDVSIRGSRFWDVKQEDMESYFELATRLDECAATLEFAEDTSSAEIAGTIVATAIAGAEEETDEYSAQSTYYFIAAGLADRFGIKLSKEQLNLQEMCEYIDRMTTDSMVDEAINDTNSMDMSVGMVKTK